MHATPKTPLSVVFRLGHMGDVALTTGVLWHRHEQTGETFVFVTRESNLPLLENHPAVAGVVGLSDAAMRDQSWFALAGELARRFAGQPLLDLHGTLRSRILALRWKGPVRRYPKYSLLRRLYERTRSRSLRRKLEAANVPQRYAMALDETPPPAEAVLPRLFLTDAERAAASAMLAPVREPGPLVGLHPYATHPAKQWPAAHWLALVEQLDAARIGWFITGRHDVPLMEGNARDLTNQTGLRASCALLDQADLLVTGDSGPMHLASGVGTPVIALFGPTAKAWGFYPAGPKDRVLEQNLPCRPCSLHGAKACTRGFECMTATTPETVLQAVQSILK